MQNEVSEAKAKLEDAFEEYKEACYGSGTLHPTQYTEVRQAFFSGVLWRASIFSYGTAAECEALKELLGQ